MQKALWRPRSRGRKKTEKRRAERAPPVLQQGMKCEGAEKERRTGLQGEKNNDNIETKMSVAEAFGAPRRIPTTSRVRAATEKVHRKYKKRAAARVRETPDLGFRKD